MNVNDISNEIQQCTTRPMLSRAIDKIEAWLESGSNQCSTVEWRALEQLIINKAKQII